MGKEQFVQRRARQDAEAAPHEPAAALAEALDVVADRVAFHRERGDFEEFVLRLRRARPVSARQEATPTAGLILPG